MFTLSEYLLSSNEDSVKLGVQLLLCQDESILDDLKRMDMGNKSKMDKLCYCLRRITELSDDIKNRLFKVCDILHEFGQVPINLLPDEWAQTRIHFEYELSNIQFVDNAKGIQAIDYRTRQMFFRIYNRDKSILNSTFDYSHYRQNIFIEPFMFANKCVLVLFTHVENTRTAFMMFSNVGKFRCNTYPRYCKVKSLSQEPILIRAIFKCLNHGCVIIPSECFFITEPYNHIEEAIFY